MYKLPYDASRISLYNPGDAVNFFQLGNLLTDPKVLCAEMARAAYIKQEDRLNKYLRTLGYTIKKTWGYGEPGTQLFVAESPKTDSTTFRTVIAFRGTEPDDPTDISSDANLLKTPWFDENNNQLGEVHKGFSNALLSDVSNGNILHELVQAILDSSYSEILLTGHSLGAALATLTATVFSEPAFQQKIKVYTFGSPLVGNQAFANEANSRIKHFRFFNCCDLVTRIPPEQLGFRHCGELNYIDRSGQIQTNFTSANIRIDRIKAASEYLLKYSFLPGHVAVRELADHAPVNYLSGVSGLRIN